MSEIRADYASGGSGLTSAKGARRHPPIAEVLRDIADDLAALRGSGTPLTVFATTDIAAFTDPPSAAEMALLRTFVNNLKAGLIAAQNRVNANGASVTIKTTKV